MIFHLEALGLIGFLRQNCHGSNQAQ